MKEVINFQMNDILEMKKKHPCGSSEWKVIKVGADIKLECCGCGHGIILKRSALQKSLKKIKKG